MKSTLTYRSFNANNQAYWPLRWGREQSNDPSYNGQPSTLKGIETQLKKMWKALALQMSDASAPHIWQTQDATGEIFWNAQDPTSGRTIRHASETEMRIWLEERYRF
ncbi:MAG: hypothetical protein HLUCCA11_14725 [Phormidesmis priestleyi Ana]|uniref:Uncharacterized protein n=1 Tax=Phormidesmis priestleyi Ana TaxID=1666911 RepID=A0A0P8C084_9CYAN|nr:MAG: hypothetical protein HLUCCA11_14725 [Phormidesmis priestleyi Ana]